MSDFNVKTSSELETLLATRRDGYGMPRGFYHDPALYAAEMRTIWLGGWLFAGFEFEIPNPGDFLTITVDGSPVLVLRDDHGSVRAFHNVCRHRGTQLCRKESGHVHAIVCPYHSWTYSRQGELVSCMGMHEGIDKSKLGLKAVHAEVVAGLIYISMAAAPPVFDGLRERFEGTAKPQGFARARIAKVTEYEVEANWKLVWENNRECFHCVQNHPQYVKANFDVYEEAYASEAIRQKMADAVARTESKWAAQGVAITHAKGGLAPFPDPDRNTWYAADRTVMVEGFDTESMDGRRVAPLMGDYQDADVGVLRMRTMPNFWVHGRSAQDDRARLLARRPVCAGRRRLPTRSAVTVLAAHQRAGLGHLQVAAEGRRLVRLRARTAVAAQGI